VGLKKNQIGIPMPNQIRVRTALKCKSQIMFCQMQSNSFLGRTLAPIIRQTCRCWGNEPFEAFLGRPRDF
jgi:hypothetical protein